MITLKGYTANRLCLSSDQKPTDVDINTIIRELDTNTYYYFDGSDWNEMPGGGGGGGGFTPTQEQLDAMNSGATTEKIEQIETNKNNISSEQAKTTGMSEGGSNYITVGGIRVYVSSTAPTGARTGDLWIGG